MSRIPVVATVLILASAACDSMGPEPDASVAIRFIATPSGGATLAANGAGSELDIVGSNGTLRLTDIHFIVDEFELEQDEDACEAELRFRGAAHPDDDDDDPDDACEEFEAGPFFVALALGGEVTVVEQDVPPGTYTRLDFEVEDVDFRDDDDDDDDHGVGEGSLLQAIRTAGFTEWPDKASMVVTGSFTPVSGPARPFTTFFEAEIEIRKRFEPPLVVTDEQTTISIEVDPSMWFLRPNGTVVDLSAFDFERTGRLVEFEVEMRDGFRRLRRH